MALTDNLIRILKTQKEAINDLEKEIHILENSDFAKENTLLKEELEQLKTDYEKTKHALKEVKDENSNLKNALYEQIYSEKLTILNLSAKKLDIYFHSNQIEGLNKLNEFEQNVKGRIDAINEELKNSHVNLNDEIYSQLDTLTQTLREKVTLSRIEYAKTNGAFSENEKSEFEDLKKEQITMNKFRQLLKRIILSGLSGKI